GRDLDNPRLTNLLRRETRRLQNLRFEEAPGEADILCDNVVRLHFDYYDSRDKTWREEWITTAPDGQPDRLPSKVRIILTVRDERGQETPFKPEPQIMMKEPLNLKAADPPPPSNPTSPNSQTKPGTPGSTPSGTPSTTPASPVSNNPLAPPVKV